MILELIEQLSRKAAERGLDFLIIGGHAMAHHGYARLTRDVDLLARETQRSSWRDVFEQLGYRVFGETDTFAQFSPGAVKSLPVDIMFVEDATWEKLRKEAVGKPAGGAKLLVPSPQHLVALKLFAAASPNRRHDAQDWADIAELVRLCRLDPSEPGFAGLVRRYGGEESLEKIRKLWQRIQDQAR